MSGSGYGCDNCIYYKGVEYLGDTPYVRCVMLPDGKSDKVKLWRGCACRVGINAPGSRQGMLF